MNNVERDNKWIAIRHTMGQRVEEMEQGTVVHVEGRQRVVIVQCGVTGSC